MNKPFHFSLLSLLFAAMTLALVAFVQPTDTYNLDLASSKATWKARKVTGEHYGSVKFKSGKLEMSGSKLTGGSFEMDMTSLTVEDLTGDMAGKLAGHLKSDDFFSVEKHPTAKFDITKVAAVDKAGNYKVTGNLVIKGISKETTFDANVAVAKGAATGTATLKIDRTQYDIRYRSANFFENLGDKAIYDDFEITVKLVAKK